MNETKAQAIIYKRVGNTDLCLCLKRAEEDGGFWHILTGTLEPGESIKACIIREIAEELGEQIVIGFSEPIREWIWKKGEKDVKVIDHVVLIKDQEIILNDEHTAYMWLAPASALDRLEMQTAKELIELSRPFLATLHEKGNQ